jgi:hypothetical protein
MSAATSASATEILTALSDRLRRAATDVAWTQWKAVGATASTRARARSMIDVEALVLLSFNLADDEPRFGDLVSDWAILNAPLLSVQRMKNLTAHGPASLRERLGVFARLALEEGKDFRWRALAANASATTAPRRTNKVRALKAQRIADGAVWLKLRLGLGVGIKADTLAFLLGSAEQWAGVRMIATATSYTLAAVGRALEDLADARLILVATGGGEPTRYQARWAAWATLLEVEAPFPAWRFWHERFAFIDAFLTWAARGRQHAVSGYAFGVKGRELMEQHRAAFTPEETAMLTARARDIDWTAYVETCIRNFAQRMVDEV